MQETVQKWGHYGEERTWKKKTFTDKNESCVSGGGDVCFNAAGAYGTDTAGDDLCTGEDGNGQCRCHRTSYPFIDRYLQYGKCHYKGQRRIPFWNSGYGADEWYLRVVSGGFLFKRYLHQGLCDEWICHGRQYGYWLFGRYGFWELSFKSGLPGIL